MVEIPHNGRTLKRGDPLRDAILAAQRHCKANGVPYPRRAVDDYYAVPFVWLGRVPYRADTLERLVLTQEARKRPVPLPDHSLLDGATRLPAENASQYAKYLAYRDLGPARSLNKVAKVMGRKAYGRGAANSGYYSALASRFRWEERVTAWDSHKEIEARRAAEKVLEDQMEEEVRRRATYLSNEWTVIEEGFAVLKQMLKYPVMVKRAETVSKDGKTIVTIWQPGKWSYATVAQLIEALTKVGRLHTGMSTSNTAMKTEDVTQRPEEKPRESPADEEMHAYAMRESERRYFEACEEWKAQHAPVRAQIAAAS